MGVWWVNLGTGYVSQVRASALWAPNHGRRPETGELYNPQWHWSLLQDARPGEFVVLCDDQQIKGVAMVSADAIADQEPPAGLTLQPTWHNRGWLLPIAIAILPVPLSRDVLSEGLFLRYFERSPLRREENGTLKGNQIYFTKIPDGEDIPFLDRLITAFAEQHPGAIERLIDSAAEAAAANDEAVDRRTIRDALVKARIGQGRFRDQLIERWEGKCCATGLREAKLLRASHIMSWKLSNNQQRLDEFNGLLLSAAYDAAFDAHLITLTNEGVWEVDPRLTAEARSQAGLGDIAQNIVVGLRPEHFPYLTHHREMARKKWINGE
ncbi:HNH endonuclease [Rhizobium laguerreae]|uniref:HNH endonuclease n=1 Tax=Rhizobium laguerreae TaxID=1076926 RepID=UPI001C9127E8|nr:HNH endonuclease signature motif containing protein [Rhizobium laguerreae]MBY3188795.1 HNH endonuclease [Rhizobium laguerreae]